MFQNGPDLPPPFYDNTRFICYKNRVPGLCFTLFWQIQQTFIHIKVTILAEKKLVLDPR